MSADTGTNGPIRVTFLGSGPSSGVPAVGMGWGNCDPANPKNERTRQSILVDINGKRLLIDTSPDLRAQLLRADAAHLDAVLFTHAHADHLHGIDDLRAVNRTMKRALPVFADPETHQQLRDRFAYTLAPLPPDKPDLFYRPVLQMHEFVRGDDIDVLGIKVGTFEQDHGFSKTTGFAFGRVVYSTDVKMLTEDVLARLAEAQLDVWVIGVFRWEEHWTHAHVDQAMKWIERVKPRRVILTHLGADIDFEALSAATPDHVQPAFDGMTVEVAAPGGEVRVTD